MRIIVLILDGVGVGALPDAADYGDAGADTLRHCAERAPDLRLPTLEKLGLGCIGDFPGIAPAQRPLACFAKMAEASAGKDTMTGHWELTGLVQKTPFPLYPEGFPPQVIDAFCRAVGKQGVLGNKAASGTEIIRELAREHLQTGWPIVYTSADSVFQIAVHERVNSLQELYSMCRAARRILVGEHRVGRVIARPFGGEIGDIHRIPGRQDFPVPPPGPTLLNRLQESGYQTIGIGKIGDIFAGSGLSGVVHTNGNTEGIAQTLKALEKLEQGLIMTNLVDFDTLYGHRNDVEGFARALVEFDTMLRKILDAMGSRDILIISADHGCDPTTPGSDHSREYVPLLLFGAPVRTGVNLGVRSTFADLGQTIAAIMAVEPVPCGISFHSQISKARSRSKQFQP